ncbi:MAG: hypothetical protein Q8942_11970 [Bacillota bacterium]|nr:hypothetical protein [Bacillota bacterium]
MRNNHKKFIILFLITVFIQFNTFYVNALESSTSPSSADISVINNVGKCDIVNVEQLSIGDIVKVYNSASGGKLLGKSTMLTNKTEAPVSIPQLGSNSGSVYVSVTSIGMAESARIKANYDAEPKSSDLDSNNIVVTNNVDTNDTVLVSGLLAGDLIKVYNAPKDGRLIGSGKLTSIKSELTVKISNLGKSAGSIYVTLTSENMLESDRVKVDFEAEPVSDPLEADYISIQNNSGKADTINFTDLNEGDTLKIYNSQEGGKLLGSAVVPISKTDLTISVPQLGILDGSVYISRKSKGMGESGRIKVDYAGEEVSDTISDDNILVANNAGIADTVSVSCLSSGDVVKVYNLNKGGKLLGSTVVQSSKSEATVSVSQLGTTAGSIYVTVTSINKRESVRTKSDYPSESKSKPPSLDNISIVNNARTVDTVKVIGLTAGDAVKIYDMAQKGKLLGSATVTGTNNDVTVTISQLGSDAGSVYISVTGKNQQESDRIKADYKEEAKSPAPYPENVTITNNARSADTVKVGGLASGDVVRIYDAASLGNFLGSATASNTDATVSIPQLGTTAGSVYITVSSSNKKESQRTQVSYAAEPVSGSADDNNITVFNNVSKADTVKVTGISAGDVIKVYDAATSGNLLGSATVSTSNADAAVSIQQLGTDAGSVYVSITSLNKQEGTRIKVDYNAEFKSNSLDTDNITVANNARAADTVNVTGLSSGDLIRIYDSDSGGSLLASAAVSGSNSDATVSIPQLGTGSGSIYLSLTSLNKKESGRLKVDYRAEAVSDVPNIDNITINNNSRSSDCITVTGLNGNDLVKVYSLESGGNILGYATVAPNGSEATISVPQLGNDSGSVFISVTSINKQESGKTKAAYNSESISDAPLPENIIITNNAKAPDTVKVTNIKGNDIVKVYDSAKSGTLLGSATVPEDDMEVTVTIKQLGSAAGNVYISVTSSNKQESSKTKAAYTDELITSPVLSENVSVTNNAKAADIIYVSGLLAGNTVKIYDDLTAGNLIGQGTVSNYNSEVSITIPQLGTNAGSIYVSITSVNKLESSKVKVDYKAEVKSSAVDLKNVNIMNNARSSDSVIVTNLTPGDTIIVYDDAKGGNLLGSATVTDDSNEAVISINQLGADSGSVYISKTDTNKQESDRIKADFLNELSSNAPDEEDTIVVNKAGMASTVTVNNLMIDDVIKVYDSDSGGNILGTAVVPMYDTEATVNVSQLGSEAGFIYVSVTSKTKLESKRTKIAYSAKATSEAPDIDYITVQNNASLADSVTMTGLNPNDAIKVYDLPDGGNLLGSATVTAGNTSAIVLIGQLGAKAGKIYVSLISEGKNESKTRTEVAYASEGQSDTPIASNVTILNNVGVSDSIQVSGLLANDLVKVYRDSTSSTPLNSATVSEDGSEAIVYIKQLGSAAGSVYITVTSAGKTESDRVSCQYLSESFAPDSNNISVVNNAVIADTITVTGLSSRDVVKVYDSVKGGILLGTATVATNDNQAIVAIPQLSACAGSIYISVTSSGRCESSRTEADYLAEQITNAVFSGNVQIINNIGTSDTINVTGLSANDEVKVYGADNGETIIGSATAPSGSSQITIPVTQLSSGAGNVYITITSIGKTESARTKVSYKSEV